MQYLILIYDIANDRVRAKIADTCLDYGLDRVQYSAFTGLLSRNHQETLMLRLRDILDDKCGNIRLIPIALKEWENQLEIDNVG
jgi:CRISPR-associated protein Cas2